MKRVYLIYPPSVVMNREDRCQQPIKELLTIPPLPPTDLMYLASVARNEGCECKIKDYSINGETLEEFKRDLLEFHPDILVVNVATPTLESDLTVCKAAKEVFPKILTLAKGAYFLKENISVLNRFDDLDIVIRGEAEQTFKEIVQGKQLEDVLGITYRKNHIVFNNGPRPFIDNLDELPFPARDLVDMELYRRPDNNKKQAVIKVSRGCPFHCFFCLATPVSGKKVRMRSVDNIIAEIRECKEKYGVRDFLFWSDIFDISREWTVNLCNRIIEEKLNIVWSSNTRADTADYELATIMKKSGCGLVSIGIESGSQYMLDKMGKKTTIRQIETTVKAFRKVGIKVYGYFVLGLPWETEKTAQETITFACKLDLNYANFYTATAFPGSRFWDYALENNLFDDEDKYKSAYYYPSVRTHELSKERVFELHKEAVRRFYLRPSFILKTLFSIKSLTELKNYTIAGISLLFKR